MKKHALITFLFCAMALCSKAHDRLYPRITFGTEWSYNATLNHGWHYNFFSPEGYRVNMTGNEFMFKSNAETYLNAGCNINENLNLAIYAGVAGIADEHTAIPVSFRCTWFFGNNPLKDRLFSYIDIGSGISVKMPPQEIFTSRVGGGYRMSLSRNSKLDFMISIKVSYTHPDIVYYEDLISIDKINRNDAIFTALSFGMAINL